MYQRSRLEVLGIRTAGRSSQELSLLSSLLPRIEAYWELLHRSPEGPLTPERAEALTLLSDDTATKEDAERVANAITFAQTPLQ